MAEEASRYRFPFINQYVKIPKRISDRLDTDHPKEYEGVRHCLGLIIVNLLARGEVAYSRNSNFYTEKRTKHYTRTNLWNAVNIALNRGYAVEAKKGYWNTKYERGLASTLSPGRSLREFESPTELELDVGSLPLLSVDKRQVFDEDGLANILSRPRSVSPESRGLLPHLTSLYGDALRLNRDYWNRMEIDPRGLSFGHQCMRRVGLTRTFNLGGVGRWFQRGELSYQQLPKEQRAKLLLDGEEVAELDYSAMHPHILYAWEGQQCPGDFYDRITEHCRCPRFVAKSLTLFAVNAPSHASLSSAVNLDKAKETKANLGRAEPKPILYDELKRQGLEPRNVVGAISEAHPAIAKYIFSGSANRLMLAESEIMTSVLLSLMEVGIPALHVHDSVVAPSRDRDTVRRVMEDEYRRHTSFGITVE
ncbi:hypothetical protein ES707_14071 [subsurface metagenome]